MTDYGKPQDTPFARKIGLVKPDMIEQVERAVYASLKVEGFSHQDFDLLNTFQKTQVNKMARAAIAAMRDIKLPDDVRLKGYPSGRAMYEAVIDAALGEK